MVISPFPLQSSINRELQHALKMLYFNIEYTIHYTHVIACKQLRRRVGNWTEQQPVN
jgi:hypothetical protein